VADRIALKLADYVVTESGFGSDMGFEKFINIVCRQGGIRPAAVVLVATVKALKLHGGASDDPRSGVADGMAAIERGAANLTAHIDIVRGFGLPCVVAVNRFPGDTDDEVKLVQRLALERGAHDASPTRRWPTAARARRRWRARSWPPPSRTRACSSPTRRRPDRREDPPHRAPRLRRRRRRLPAAGARDAQALRRAGPGQAADLHGQDAPLDLARPALRGAPSGFKVPVRDLRAYTGAGFITALCGDVMQMPGLGKNAAGLHMDLDETGKTVGLF